jgi:homogentisate 1,2-dioxygenase
MWKALQNPSKPTDFVESITTYGGIGDPSSQFSMGYAIHGFACNKSMIDKCFVNTDGDFLIAPEEGSLHIQTEFGLMKASPTEIVIIPQGLKFRIEVEEEGKLARGFICEAYHSTWVLPEHGVLGPAGLANSRHFLTPVAHYEDRDCLYKVIHKADGELFQVDLDHSPFDVVAYYGNHLPFKYDVKLFDSLGNTKQDHQDPSSHTVVSALSLKSGVSIVDFVAFVPRCKKNF